MGSIFLKMIVLLETESNQEVCSAAPGKQATSAMWPLANGVNFLNEDSVPESCEDNWTNDSDNSLPFEQYQHDSCSQVALGECVFVKKEQVHKNDDNNGNNSCKNSGNFGQKSLNVEDQQEALQSSSRWNMHLSTHSKIDDKANIWNNQTENQYIANANAVQRQNLLGKLPQNIPDSHLQANMNSNVSEHENTKESSTSGEFNVYY